MSPIKWKLILVDGDPEEEARKLASRNHDEGMVVMQNSRSSDTVRFSSIVRTGGLSQLALSLIAAFSASEGIRKDTGIITWLRWPNRVVVGEAVVARSAFVLIPPSRERRAILNISVNRLHAKGQGSTSLEDALGVQVDQKMLVEKILDSLSWMHFGWTNNMEEHALKRVRSMTETLERVVSVRVDGAKLKGTAIDIDHLGRLVVELEGGAIVKLDAADELVAE